jgi:Domain of unknown function (DUF4430)
MKPAIRRLAAAAALTCAVAAAGCGLGAGASSPGIATLTVTRDYGSKTLLEATDDDPPSSETVIRFLDSEADITTRYGGGFVQSINGISGGGEGGGSDWFFYVNGVESPVGSADVRVQGGDRIWWDYREWTAAMSVPAVVGSWPEPFAQASSADPRPVRVVCLGVSAACKAAARHLADAGVSARTVRHAPPGSGALRVLVGPWAKVRADPAVDALRGSPGSTGVFATFKGPIGGSGDLIGLNPRGKPVRDLGRGAGLVAALGRAGDPQTWIATGSGGPAVLRAAELLNARSLRDRYAVAAVGGRSLPLPILGGRRGP